MKGKPRTLQISIRTLLGMVAVFALCVAGVLNGAPISLIAATLLVLVLLMQAINGAVGSGDRRCFAIGLLIPSIAYLALTLSVGENEYASSSGRLPTSQLLQTMARSIHIKRSMMASAMPDALRNVRDTMPLGHLFIAIAFGYVGGYYALWIRRKKKPDGGV